MNCGCNSKDFANLQNAEYDIKNDTILYGINKNMRALGVSDGTCNQINPLIHLNTYKCGFGVAGGNPCKNNIQNNQLNTNEKFENTNKTSDNTGFNLTNYVNIIIIILVACLLYLLVK